MLFSCFLLKKRFFPYFLPKNEKPTEYPRILSFHGVQNQTFISLSDLIGKKKLIKWFDPLLFTDQVIVKELMTRIWDVRNQMVIHTDKHVFSFADILMYQKVSNNLIR